MCPEPSPRSPVCGGRVSAGLAGMTLTPDPSTRPATQQLLGPIAMSQKVMGDWWPVSFEAWTWLALLRRVRM